MHWKDTGPVEESKNLIEDRLAGPPERGGIEPRGALCTGSGAAAWQLPMRHTSVLIARKVVEWFEATTGTNRLHASPDPSRHATASWANPPETYRVETSGS